MVRGSSPFLFWRISRFYGFRAPIVVLFRDLALGSELLPRNVLSLPYFVPENRVRELARNLLTLRFLVQSGLASAAHLVKMSGKEFLSLFNLDRLLARRRIRS